MTSPFPLIWFSDGQWVRLDVLLAQQLGLDLAGWSKLIPTAISPDGAVIAGTGLDFLNRHRAWAAMIPGPASGPVLVLVCAIGLGRRRR